MGIWKCRLCDKTQAGGAYVLNTGPSPVYDYMPVHTEFVFMSGTSVTVRSTIRRLRELQES